MQAKRKMEYSPQGETVYAASIVCFGQPEGAWLRD